jgi:hypothetical protein
LVIAENLFIRQLIYFENCRVSWCINNIKNRRKIGLERNSGRGVDLMRFSRRGPAMLNLSTVSTLLGAAFGLRFGVLILLPVIALELAIVAVNGFALGESAGRLAIVMSLVATTSQLGYLGGSIVGMAEPA